MIYQIHSKCSNNAVQLLDCIVTDLSLLPVLPFDPTRLRLLAADHRVFDVPDYLQSSLHENAWITVGGYSSVIKKATGPWLDEDCPSLATILCCRGSFKPQLERGRYCCCSLGSPIKPTLKWKLQRKNQFPFQLSFLLFSLPFWQLLIWCRCTFT